MSGAPGTVLYRKSAPGYCFTFIKRLDEAQRQQLLGKKTLDLTRITHINWLIKIELREPELPGL